MGDFLTAVFSVAFLGQILRITVPYALAAIGGTMSERSGVINIALEGKLLFGALAAAMGAHASGSVFIGALCGAGGGLLVAALYGLVVIRFKGDQIVAGVAINLLALGVTRYLLHVIYNSSSNSPATPGFDGGVWTNWLFYTACALIAAVWFTMYKTPYGLRLRAVGEHPEAAASVGVRVAVTRWIAVLAAGGLAGLGGAWMALSNHGFSDNMSGGRGYIALAAVIMGKWRPGWAAAACLLFGTADALQLQMQASSIGLPSEIVQMFPWVLTMVALAGFIGKSRAPAALGQ